MSARSAEMSARCTKLRPRRSVETSPAFEKGLRSGDVITEAGQEKVASAADLTARIDEARDAGRSSVLLLVRRGADPRFVALPVEKN